MKTLVVVAHPDDHILWMGGTILRFKDWDWYILSICNSHNDNFQPKLEIFQNGCKELGVKKYHAREMKDYQQRELMEIEQPLKMQKEILAFADKEYDLVFTHSIDANCEYGYHANHIEVRDSLNKLLDEQLLKAKMVFYFCYKAQGNNQSVIADENKADYKLELVREEINKKKKLKQSFIWAKGDLRGLALWDNDEPKIEAFNIKKISDIELPDDFLLCKK